MKPIHALSIALLLGLAAALGAVAATRTTTTIHAQSTAAPSQAAWIKSRQVRLNRWQHQLQRALHQRSPKLPRLAHFPKVVVPPPAPAYVSRRIASAPAAAPRTIYVHAKPAAGPARFHEHDHEGEQAPGGSHDD